MSHPSRSSSLAETMSTISKLSELLGGGLAVLSVLVFTRIETCSSRGDPGEGRPEPALVRRTPRDVLFDRKQRAPRGRQSTLGPLSQPRHIASAGESPHLRGGRRVL